MDFACKGFTSDGLVYSRLSVFSCFVAAETEVDMIAVETAVFGVGDENLAHEAHLLHSAKNREQMHAI